MPIARFIGSVAVVAAIAGTALGEPEVLVGSWSTNSIRRYDLAGQYLGDLVPPLGNGLDLPDGMALGADGLLYVASSDSGQVLRFDPYTGAFQGEIASGLAAPGNLNFGPDGALYVCEKNASRVLRTDLSPGSTLQVFASGGGLVVPVGLAWHEGVMYVADFNGRAIRAFDATTGASLGTPVLDLAMQPLIERITPAGTLLVTSHPTSDVREYDLSTGMLLRTIGAGGPISCPVGHLILPDGSMLVASWQNNRLLRYDQATGAYLGQFAAGSGLALPNDLLLLPDPPVMCRPDLTTGAVAGLPGYGVPNGVVNNDDFFYYLAQFAAGNLAVADLTAGAVPGAPGYGVPNGVLNNDDFFFYLTVFAAGC